MLPSTHFYKAAEIQKLFSLFPHQIVFKFSWICSLFSLCQLPISFLHLIEQLFSCYTCLSPFNPISLKLLYTITRMTFLKHWLCGYYWKPLSGSLPYPTQGAPLCLDLSHPIFSPRPWYLPWVFFVIATLELTLLKFGSWIDLDSFVSWFSVCLFLSYLAIQPLNIWWQTLRNLLGLGIQGRSAVLTPLYHLIPYLSINVHLALPFPPDLPSGPGCVSSPSPCQSPLEAPMKNIYRCFWWT